MQLRLEQREAGSQRDRKVRGGGGDKGPTLAPGETPSGKS